MRIATALASIALLLPISSHAQPPVAGHFDDWPSDAQWGPDKRTFDVRFGVRRVEATFTVASNGFGWQRSFTGMKQTFTSWRDVTAWCSSPGTVLVRTRQNSPPRFGVHDVAPEALATIVDEYFRRHVPDAERRSADAQCTPAVVDGPNPADLSRVRELLEAAATETRE